MKAVFFSTSIFLLTFLPGLAETGSVTGTIQFPKGAANKRVAVEKYTGSISGKVAKPPAKRAAVWLTQKGLTAPVKVEPVALDQKEYQFGKSILVISKGTTVFFPNEDDQYHNVFSLSKAKRFDLGRYKKGERPVPSIKFDKVGLVDVRCEIHEHMRALVMVVDTPYLGTTDEKGSFQLSGIAPGNYTVHAQLDAKTRWVTEVQITSGGTAKAIPRRTKK